MSHHAPRRRTIEVRVTVAELKALEHRARASGASRSDYLRSLWLTQEERAAADWHRDRRARLPAPNAEAVTMVGRVGGLVKALLPRLDRQDPGAAAEARRLLAELSAAVRRLAEPAP